MSRRLLRMLVGLYPRRWRRRYGAELEELVTELAANRDRKRVRLAAGLIANAGVERIRGLGAWGAAATIVVAALITTTAVLTTPSHQRPRQLSAVPVPSGLVARAVTECRAEKLKLGTKLGFVNINPANGFVLSHFTFVCGPDHLVSQGSSAS
jgi:hypothetical protein